MRVGRETVKERERERARADERRWQGMYCHASDRKIACAVPAGGEEKYKGEGGRER